MTEKFKKWVDESTKGVDFVGYGAQVHCLSSRAADFWLRALMETVELKTIESSEYRSVGDAFVEVIRELGLEER